MNVKHFTLGMGTGIILITLVFYLVYSFSYGRPVAAAPGEITDAEIAERAAKLGMIYFDALPTAVSEPQLSQQEIIDQAFSLGMVFPFEQGEPDGLELTEEPEEAPTEEAAGDGKRVEVYIPRGSAAGEVADILQEKGIVEDAGAFLAFLKARSETKRLQYGTYNLPILGEFEEILQTIKR